MIIAILLWLRVRVGHILNKFDLIEDKTLFRWQVDEITGKFSRKKEPRP